MAHFGIPVSEVLVLPELLSPKWLRFQPNLQEAYQSRNGAFIMLIFLHFRNHLFRFAVFTIPSLLRFIMSFVSSCYFRPD